MTRTPVGWERMEATWWLMVAASLAKPWPREAVLFDLRWHVSQDAQGTVKMPGRPALCERWGWTEKKARLIMRGGEWQDPRASRGPAEGQPRASGNTDERRESDEKGQPRASRGPAEGHTRDPLCTIHDHVAPEQEQAPAAGAAPPPADAGLPVSEPPTAGEVPPPAVSDPVAAPTTPTPTPTPEPIPEPSTTTATPEAPTDRGGDDGEQLDRCWRALTQACAAKPDAWKLGEGRRKSLRSRLRECGEDAVLQVAEWVRTSRHERANFLRERGDVDTLLRREKFETYLAFARTPEVTPRETTKTTPRPTQPSVTSLLMERFQCSDPSTSAACS